jgi:integrase
VPLHSLLAEAMKTWKQESPYSQSGDWVFPSFKLKGKQSRCANMLVEDYLRPAAVKAGVLAKDDDSHRFGFHNLRHSLASYLVRSKSDPKTVQNLLRHSNVKTTLQLYAHSVSDDRLAAQGQMLAAILQQPATSAVN